MGSEMLAILDQDTSAVSPQLAAVPQWFESWEQCLSRFRPDSELSRLNRTFDQPVKVSRTLWEVLSVARQAERQSGGLLTPTVLNALVEAGYDRDFEQLACAGIAEPSGNFHAAAPELATVLFDEREHSVCLHEDVHLDLGGVAKGWAADQAMRRLREQGPALVDAAGDIAISGPNLDGGPWVIGVADPLRPGHDILNIELHAGGIATSGKDRRRWQRGGLWRHHIIDPRSGTPALTDLLTVTVVAADVMEAEAGAKTAFLMGGTAGLEWIEANTDLAGLLVMEDGTCWVSTRMQDLIQ